MKLLAFFLGVALAGCASQPEQQYAWAKKDGTQQDFQMSAGQCEAHALSILGATNVRGLEIYLACMRGKGWNYVQRQHLPGSATVAR